MEDPEVETIIRDQIKFLTNQRIKLGGSVSDEEIKDCEAFISQHMKLCYPQKSVKGKMIPLKGEKQHKVPTIFLQGFTDGDSVLYQYDLQKAIVSKDKLPISAILSEEDFYVLIEGNGKRNYIIEKFLFSYLLEGKIGGVIEKVRKRDKLSSGDWQILAGFISFQYVRTDAFINDHKESVEFLAKARAQYSYDTLEQFESRIKLIKEETGKDFGNVKELYDFMKSGNYTVEAVKQSLIPDIISQGNAFWKHFLNGHYEVLETNKSNFFLVSDNPFFIIPPKGQSAGEGTGLFYPPGSEIIIPINHKQCLRIQLDPPGYDAGVSMSYRTINHRETNRINQYICKNATRFILSKNKEYLIKLIGTIDFKKAKHEKEYGKHHYSNGFIMGRQLYPL